MTNQARALLPCPFCGSAAHFKSDTDGWQWVECESCCMASNRRASLMEDCRPLLAEAWNRRTPTPPAQECNQQAEALAQECSDYATSLRSTINVVKLEGREAPKSMQRAADLFERAAARIAELWRWQDDVRSNSPLLARLEKAESAVSGLQKRKDDWEWRAMEAEAQLEAKQAALLGYDSGLQAGNRVTLCFDSQANATRWLEGFCNSYDAAHGTKSIALPIPLPTAQTAQTQEQKKRD